MTTHKSQFPKGYRSVTQLARYVGLTARRIEQMYATGELPKPERVLDDGTKLWSTDQAKEIAEWQLKRKDPLRRALPPTAAMRRRNDPRLR